MPPSELDERSEARGQDAAAPLSLEQVRVSYGSASVLEGVNLVVRRGEIVGLAGRNGAGKSTCLRAVSGLVPLRSGSVCALGRPMPRTPEKVLSAGVAHVPEGRRVFAGLTVEENLRVAACGAGRPYGAAEEARVLAIFPALAALLQRKAGYLSGGEQQMLAIGRGLLARPKVLMIDEVSLGLSPRLTGEMWQALRGLPGPELSLLIVDQNVRMLAEYCDRVYLLADGVVEEAGHGEERTDRLRALYFD
jgi:branched-chain amino acid transport system ATP-binding protein